MKQDQPACVTYDLKLSDPERAAFLDAARLCGYWVAHSQSTPQRPWGPIVHDDSADAYRFIEKYAPASGRLKPAGVWLTGLYICGLLELSRAPGLDRSLFDAAARQGARYLKSVQCFDLRWPGAIGGFHEVYPGHAYSAPRDAATGAMGLIALYRATGEDEYLDRAVRFGQWYGTHGSDKDGYPWDDYDLEAGRGESKKRGDWQAGGALVYYQLWKLTSDETWRDRLLAVCDVLETICANDPGTDTAYDFHGSNIISIGNDDFASTALMAGFLSAGKTSYRDLAAARLRAELGRQAEHGPFPGYGGTFVTSLELLEALDLAAAGHEIVPPHELLEPLLRAGRFSLGLQERMQHDRYLHGGVYGESNYANTRSVVHGRDTAYALQLWLRLAGHRASTYTLLGWRTVEGEVS
jgi:hypothetical protein